MSRTLYARILLCGFAAAAGLGHAALTTDVPPTPCRTVDVGEDSNATAHDAAELLDAGWTGRAGDGAERLYSPECESESARTVSSPTDRDAPGAGWCIVWAEGEVEQPRADWAAYCDARPELWTS